LPHLLEVAGGVGHPHLRLGQRQRVIGAKQQNWLCTQCVSTGLRPVFFAQYNIRPIYTKMIFFCHRRHETRWHLVRETTQDKELLRIVRINPNLIAPSRARKFTLWVSNSFTSHLVSHLVSCRISSLKSCFV
jgi:hypothetical protein